MERARYDDCLVWKRSLSTRARLPFVLIFLFLPYTNHFTLLRPGGSASFCARYFSCHLSPAVGTRPPLWHPTKNFVSALNSPNSSSFSHSHLFEIPHEAAPGIIKVHQARHLGQNEAFNSRTATANMGRWGHRMFNPV
jgi:hypothetical protein